MSTQELFWVVVLCIAVGQGLFLAIGLWTLDRGHKACNRVLAGLLGFFTLTVAEYALAGTKTLDDLPHLTGISYGYIFLCGPALYLYIRTHRFRHQEISWRDAWHLSPFGGLVVFYQLPFFFWSGAEKAVYVREQLLTGVYYYEWPHVLLTTLGVVHMGLYLVALLRLRPVATRPDDEPEQATLFRHWYQALTVLFGGFVVLRIGYLILLLTDATYATLTSYAMPIGMTAFIYGIGFIGFRHPEVFRNAPTTLPQREPTSSDPSVSSYATSPLDEEALADLACRLEAYMKSARPYLDASLCVADLAHALEVPSRQVSQVLNGVLGESFFDYVNRYRIAAAQRLLGDPAYKDATILHVLYEAGFNSKSTFNRVFKEQVGQTPSAYRKAQAMDPK
ncbi:MAG TPA: AraC family transcriptional regulator [Rhodothermales bacterium]|nr:AraC family transcriptional regulator [Rhodothermales bacterium]